MESDQTGEICGRSGPRDSADSHGGLHPAAEGHREGEGRVPGGHQTVPETAAGYGGGQKPTGPQVNQFNFSGEYMSCIAFYRTHLEVKMIRKHATGSWDIYIQRRACMLLQVQHCLCVKFCHAEISFSWYDFWFLLG